MERWAFVCWGLLHEQEVREGKIRLWGREGVRGRMDEWAPAREGCVDVQGGDKEGGEVGKGGIPSK